MKKGFTLIEIVLVMLIMGALLLITMNTGLRCMDSLQARYDQDAVKQFMHSIISSSQQSNIIHGKTYESLRINFGERSITALTNSNDIIDRLTLKQGQFQFDGSPPSVLITPYHLGCEKITGNTSNIQLIYKGTKISCFQLDLGTCKPIVKSCEK